METEADALRLRAAQLRAQADACLARAAKEERARQTRRKILVGSVILHDLATSSGDEGWLRSYLQRRLDFFGRSADRELVSRLPHPDDAPPAQRGRGRPRKVVENPPPEESDEGAAGAAGSTSGTFGEA
ncbi:hypothetical protein [Xanthobacter sediminis]|uniref:hypothetical protein n=1 Tax=Xanthobacter sediminis TaxID=3119926 RepID=UPI0037284208